MSNTCGYLCPQCEGKGFLEDGKTCDWCTINSQPSDKEKNLSSLSDPILKSENSNLSHSKDDL